MIVVGLTGSIAMGKSTVAAMFAAEGAPVFDSDAAVHAFYSSPARDRRGGGFSRRPRRMARSIATCSRKRSSATAPRWRGSKASCTLRSQKRGRIFFASPLRERRRLVVVDVPLLFESGGDRSVDVVVVVSASEIVQKARALAREGMTLERFEKIIAKQTPDREKRRRAHMVIDTNGALEATRAQVAWIPALRRRHDRRETASV